MPMATTTGYRSGDVVLVRFPFTDLSTMKRRPALVVSPESFQRAYGDVVVLALTSQPQNDSRLELTDPTSAGLLKRTWCKPIIGTLALSIVVRRLGSVGAGDFAAARTALQYLLDPAFA